MRDQISTRIADVTKTVTDSYAETNQRVLAAVVENSRKVADFYVKTADQVAQQLPEIDLPFEVPTPAEAADRYVALVERVVDMNRDLSDRIVKLNRDYADRVVAMLRDEPATPAAKPAAAKPAARKVTKKVTKPAAKKTTRRPAKKAAKRTTAAK